MKRRSIKSWTVDEAIDANGHYTIRPNDGTKNGDISEQPIATVYTQDHAALAAAAPDLLAELQDLLRLVSRNRIQYSTGRIMPESEQKIYEDSARAALAKAKGDL